MAEVVKVKDAGAASLEEATAAYELAYEQYLATLPIRDQVPSERERRVRAKATVVEPVLPPAPHSPRVGLLHQALGSLKMMRPKVVAGNAPVLPLVLLCLSLGWGFAEEYAFSPLSVLAKGDLGFDLTTLATISSAGLIVQTLLFPLSGWLADRAKHRVWLSAAGAAIRNIGVIVAGLAPGTGALLAGRSLSGVGPGVELPVSTALLADYYPLRSRAGVFGILGLALALGGSVGSIAVILLVFTTGTLGWRGMMISIGVVGLLIAVVLPVLREPARGQSDRETMGLDTTAPIPPPIGWSEVWRVSAGIRTLRRLWYAVPLITAAQRAYIFLYFVLGDRFTGPKASHGLGSGLFNSPNFLFYLLGSAAGVQVVALVLATPVTARLMVGRPGKVMVLLGMVQVVQAFAMLLLLFAPPLLALAVFLVATGLASLLAPLQNTLLTSIVPARIRGQGLQTIAPFQLLGFLLGPVLGHIADVSGPTNAILAAVPVFVLGGIITASGAGNVEADIRASVAASLADDEVRAAKARGAAKLVVCRDVDVTYDGTQVLFGVDFDVEQGEIVALLGTNGAGKSTLLRAICGLQTASNGAVFLDGEDVTHKAPYLNAADGVVFVPGGRAIFPTLTVAENLRTAGWTQRHETDYVQVRTAEMLDLFPILRERMDTQAGNLSGGEQQMVALSQAFLMRPRLLMIDELSLGLAPSVVEQLLEAVRAIHAQGTTVVLVEQSINVALTIADRAVFMEKGEVRFDGPTDELLEKPDLVRSVFLGAALTGPLNRASSRPAGVVSDMEPPVLSLHSLGLRYGGVRALEDVTLEVFPGEVVGVIGPNGAGKSSLFDVVSGFARPDAGRVVVDGTDATYMPPDVRARLGLARAFQSSRLFPSLTVRENIAVGLEQRLGSRSALAAAAWLPHTRRSEQKAFRRVDDLVELLGLGPFADKFVNELSTGSRRMVDLACAMAMEPKVLLLDEPSSGMAQAEVEALGPLVQRLAIESTCGVLVIEHDIPLVMAMSDRLVAMELGHVVAAGLPSEVLADPRVVRSYLSASDAVVHRSGSRLAKALSDAGLTPDA